MEYVYAAMLLHKAGQKIDESSVRKVLESAGIKADAARIKALVAAMDGVDIEKAIKETAIPAQAAPSEAKAREKKEDKKSEEEDKKSEEQAAAGLGALFG